MKLSLYLLLLLAALQPAQAQHAKKKPAANQPTVKTAVVTITLEPAVQDRVTVDPGTGTFLYTVSAAQFAKDPTLRVSFPGYQLKSLRMSAIAPGESIQMFDPWNNPEVTDRFVMRGDQYAGLLKPGTTLYLEHIVLQDAGGKKLEDQSIIVTLN